MKSLMMKLVIGLIATFSATSALADCHIWLSACAPQKIAPNSYFADAYQGSEIDPNRCLRRAREYLGWCGNPPGGVNAYFVRHGLYTIAVHVNRSGSVLYTPNKGGSLVPVTGATSGY